MRLNQYIAKQTGGSRRAADTLISQGRVTINGQPAELGQSFSESDVIAVDGKHLDRPVSSQTIMLNKPVGYVCSRVGQGSKTIYDLLPKGLHGLKPVGRLDKDSSGLLLLTNDGHLANQLTHPKYQKAKVYEVTLNKPLTKEHFEAITKDGVLLADGPSRLQLKPLSEGSTEWEITMHEGRNRQIRRTFETLGYKVTRLHRTQFGQYKLNIEKGNFILS